MVGRYDMSRGNEDFDAIYAAGGWDGQGSGPGSTEEFTREFRKFFQGVLYGWNPWQVIDLGCGDWQWQLHVHWTGSYLYRFYCGVDIVEKVIRSNNAAFPDRHRVFHHGEIVAFARSVAALPDAVNHSVTGTPIGSRLFLVKDVLHHMTEEDADALVAALSGETVLWVCDLTDDGKVIGPSENVRKIRFDHLPIAFEFERPPTYKYGRKAAFLQ